MKLKMKAISIKQPWAWLIVNGYKDCENRKWTPSCSGEILIQASKQFDKKGYDFVKKNMSYIKNLPKPEHYLQGGIVGKATITKATNIVTSRWHEKGCIGIYLTDAEELPFMPCKGRLSIFEVEYEE